MKNKNINSIDGNPAVAAEEVREKMERRAKRAVGAVERRAKRAVRELIEREEEYKELIDDRIDQMKDRYRVDRGVDKRVTAAQNTANVIKNEIGAASAKARNGIDDRVKQFKDGVAVVRVEVDAGILTPEAACSFVDKIHEHALMTEERIDNDLSDADASMRRRVNKAEYGF